MCVALRRVEVVGNQGSRDEEERKARATVAAIRRQNVSKKVMPKNARLLVSSVVLERRR